MLPMSIMETDFPIIGILIRRMLTLCKHKMTLKSVINHTVLSRITNNERGQITQNESIRMG
mgnify:CR=1 FL=1